MKIIVIHDARYGIAKNGKQFIHITEDLRWFRKITGDHPVAMGRVTAEQLPGKKPLKGRENIVLSRTMRKSMDLMDNGFKIGSMTAIDKMDNEAFIIGGATVYNQVLSLDWTRTPAVKPLVDEIYGTHVLHDFDCDKRILLNQYLNLNDWRFERLSDVKLHVSSDGSEYPYYHYRLTRKVAE